MSNQTLTLEQAYLAMYDYFDILYQRTKSAELGGLLSDMSILPDGGPLDPAVKSDWMKSVQRAIDDDVDAGTIKNDNSANDF